MRRRRLLQLGAALALPLPGCPAPATPVAPALNGPAPAPKGSPGPPATRAEAPSPTASPGNPGDDAAPAPAGTEAPAAAPAPPPFARVIAKVGRNHGHVFTVSLSEVKLGAERTYDLSGTSGHPHAVTLSEADMKSLLEGRIVRMQSTRVGGHAHRLFVRCAPAVDPPEWVSACEIEVGGKDEHEMVIPASDMAAKTEKTYDIQGVAGHPHSVTLATTDFERLAKGEELTLTSSTSKLPDPHAHLVFIKYKPAKG
jgi:hypothetical protein